MLECCEVVREAGLLRVPEKDPTWQTETPTSSLDLGFVLPLLTLEMAGLLARRGQRW